MTESSNRNSSARAPPRSKFNPNAWMWKDRVNNEPIGTIDPSTIQPSPFQVSSSSGYQVISTYNWLNVDQATIRIPGVAPTWQDIALPVDVSKDARNIHSKQDVSRLPKYPFGPVFEAAAIMNPDIRFDDVHIIVTRNALRKLFDLCKGNRPQDFRVDLRLVHNTLLIERREASASFLTRGSTESGWGRSFEKTFTRFPPGWEDSACHERVLRYCLGDLDCVVRFEVDACYNESDEQLASALDDLSLASNRDAAHVVRQMGNRCADSRPSDLQTIRDQLSDREATLKAGMDHTTAAELKSGTKFKPAGQSMPQLWFGRTRWRISGRHTDGTFTEVKKQDVGADFEEWEGRNQTHLRKLVTVLSQLRDIVKKNGGRNCFAVYERKPVAQTIRVFESSGNGQALSTAIIDAFWSSGETTAESTLG